MQVAALCAWRSCRWLERHEQAAERAVRGEAPATVEPTAGVGPTVSLLVPARDEARNVEGVIAGMLAGVWDLALPCPVTMDGRLYCGLYIEMKSGRNNLTEKQKWFREAVGDGHIWAVSHSWHNAALVILSYLDIPRTHPAWYGLEAGK